MLMGSETCDIELVHVSLDKRVTALFSAERPRAVYINAVSAQQFVAVPRNGRRGSAPCHQP